MVGISRTIVAAIALFGALIVDVPAAVSADPVTVTDLQACPSNADVPANPSEDPFFAGLQRSRTFHGVADDELTNVGPIRQRATDVASPGHHRRRVRHRQGASWS